MSAASRAASLPIANNHVRHGEDGDSLGESTASRSDARASTRSLAALRPIEHHPDREVFAEVLEPVWNSRGDEQQVARLKRHARGPVEEHSSASCYDVDLVARVGRLRVVAAWRIQLHGERAMLEELDESLAARAGEP